MAARPCDCILEDDRLRFLLLRSPAANQDSDGLLEIEKPERHLQIIHVDYLGEFAERRRVLVMRVQQDDVRVRMLRRDRR